MLLAMPESWQVTPNRACSHRTFPSLEIGGCGLQDYNNHASTYIQNSQWRCHKTQVNREQACADISMYNVIVHGLVYKHDCEYEISDKNIAQARVYVT